MNSARLLVQKLDELRKEHGIQLNVDQTDQLIRMDELVVKWNRSLSLIGFSSKVERIDRFFVEAVHASMWLPGKGVAIDIGSGGGSPVLPMAVCRPDVCWTLLEPNQRKKVFLEEVSAELSLKHINVVRERFEHYVPKTKARFITTRGVSMSAESVNGMRSWLEKNGQVVLLTGGEAKARIARGVAPPWRVKKEVALSPRQESWLVIIELN